MPSCTSCGSPIPEGQGSCCSMCYGDISYGTDGYYYEDWARQQQAQEERDRQDELEYERMMEQKQTEDKC